MNISAGFSVPSHQLRFELSRSIDVSIQLAKKASMHLCGGSCAMDLPFYYMRPTMTSLTVIAITTVAFEALLRLFSSVLGKCGGSIQSARLSSSVFC
jgi:hypothetical protein